MNELAERVRTGEKESPASSPARIHMNVPVAGDGQTHGIAKTVLLRTPGGYVIAVIPMESTIDIANVEGVLGECPVCEASDEERSVLFPELVGVEVPAFGSQYGVRTLVDIHLAANPIVEITDNQGKPFAMLFEDFDLFENPIRGLISR
ncbi:MAG: YbaK/EbsC family protein [Planctomycetota bacterium]